MSAPFILPCYPVIHLGSSGACIPRSALDSDRIRTSRTLDRTLLVVSGKHQLSHPWLDAFTDLTLVLQSPERQNAIQ
ncbi:hypothetical protein BU25DRAFT_412439 [Macroventuria anomochaeta]|uniref:Uncharacterized protein n=1 Tax=Macroventuria anomochaeta TaxID=301207 RepID=A0ACB6RVH0_9PLEO|nr:uncharacterized protein BU25DRAFT_412439 [Macroventuria anomochaeta]KAF2625788.1 hypothetical protein BU25DRAFT_412439 [Macroventuria anomochaeta]